MNHLRDKNGRFIKGNPSYLKGRNHTEEAKRKLSIAHTGKKLSKLTRERISMATSGPNNPHWNGGSQVTHFGYVKIHKPSHPFCDCNGYVVEHRLIAEEALGRYLSIDEMAHHINENKSDNRNENLIICTKTFHYFIHKRMRRRRVKHEVYV